MQWSSICRTNHHQHPSSYSQYNHSLNNTVSLNRMHLTFVYNFAKCQLVFTSSSAVAERPRDALRLSVVNFNNTICRVQSSVISYFHFRFTVRTHKLFCSRLFVMVVHAGCDKQRFYSYTQSLIVTRISQQSKSPTPVLYSRIRSKFLELLLTVTLPWIAK